jgi:hypothetical protein
VADLAASTLPFNMPSASPAFNYTFERQDDIVKASFTVAFGR